MSRILRIARRAGRASIWGRTSVSAEDARVAGLLRYGLPGYDVFVIVFGTLGFFGGIPALRDTFSTDYAEVWGLVLASTGAFALAGVAFPSRLSRLEFSAKAFMVGLLVVYSGAVLIAGWVAGDLGRGAVGWAILAMAVLPSWRLGDIARDRRRHGWR